VVAGALVAAAATALLGATTAIAHPLGNFSVNHSHSLRFTRTGIVDDAVIDAAEIPTAQAERTVDADGDGSLSARELSAHGEAQCTSLRDDVELSVDGAIVVLAVTKASFERVPGTAGLSTSRLECTFEAVIDLAGSHSVAFADRFEPGRVGWREITAVGDGVQLVNSPVPTRSPTDGLRSYPVDLLSSPLDVRDASFDIAQGTPGAPTIEDDSSEPQGGTRQSISDGGPLARFVDRITRVFDDLIGRRDLTLGVGLVAVALAIVLGASHALLPGHGKTVMAAYIAGRQGTARDAVVVGATVTATHTGGVLLLGLALTISSSLAGETVLAWLGIASGLLIAGLGASLLIGSARHRPSGLHHGHRHGGRGHSHDHGHGGHHHRTGHAHGHDEDGAAHDRAPGASRRSLVLQVASSSGEAEQPRPERARVASTKVGRRSGGAVAIAERPRTTRRAVIIDRKAAPVPTPGAPPVSRRALVGMGIAGGLVPSPSALIVLLSAIALGRTAFGVLLVIGYGVGMAGTLTVAGLLLVRVRDRYQRRAAGRTGRTVGTLAKRWQVVMPYATATLVLVVGIGLTLRSLDQLG
jgi:ABC-type nickel/cobalt efflux system permease component RcnA